MHPQWHRTLAVLTLLAGATAPLAGQSAVRGEVREEGSNRPLPGVRVVMERTFQQAITDANGRFLITDLPLGTRTLLFSSIGHIPLRLQITLSMGDTTRADVQLMADPFRLDTLVVTAPDPRANPRLAEFEARRRMGIGFHLDSAYLRRAEGRRMSEVLREAPSIRVMPALGADGATTRYYVASVRRTGLHGEPCYLSVYLDGVPMYRSGGIGGGGFGEPVDFARDINVSSLDAVEVYASAAEVPVEFAGRSADCGVVLLWTRRGR